MISMASSSLKAARLTPFFSTEIPETASRVISMKSLNVCVFSKQNLVSRVTSLSIFCKYLPL